MRRLVVAVSFPLAIASCSSRDLRSSFAVLADTLYAVSTPVSKVLLRSVPPTMVAAFLSFVFLKEHLSGIYMIALVLMIAGTIFTMADTIVHSHIHKHHHFLTHTHDGSTHSHEIIHSHEHNHYVTDDRHGHHHTQAELEKELV